KEKKGQPTMRIQKSVKNERARSSIAQRSKQSQETKPAGWMSQQRSMIEAESTHHDFEQMSGLEQMSGRDLASITKPGGRQARSRVALGRWAALLASVSGTISVTGCVENRSTFYVER